MNSLRGEIHFKGLKVVLGRGRQKNTFTMICVLPNFTLPNKILLLSISFLLLDFLGNHMSSTDNEFMRIHKTCNISATRLWSTHSCDWKAFS